MIMVAKHNNIVIILIIITDIYDNEKIDWPITLVVVVGNKRKIYRY